MNKPVIVCFDTSNTGWSIKYDHITAEKIGTDNYRLTGIPRYVYGVSSQDVIVAQYEDEQLNAKKIIERGGHSTFRVIFKEQKSVFDQFKYITPLHEMGCHFDKPLHMMFAIDVPPGVSLENVIKYLKELGGKGVWEYEEGYVFHANEVK